MWTMPAFPLQFFIYGCADVPRGLFYAFLSAVLDFFFEEDYQYITNPHSVLVQRCHKVSWRYSGAAGGRGRRSGAIEGWFSAIALSNVLV
jgi:hypothetical protein